MMVCGFPIKLGMTREGYFAELIKKYIIREGKQMVRFIDNNGGSINNNDILKGLICIQQEESKIVKK